MMVTLAECRQEIEGLHQFFQDWFRGDLPQNQAAFARFESVLGADFMLINPDGAIVKRGDLIKGLYGAYGSQPTIKIWVQNCQLRLVTKQTAIATYEEWQQDGNKPPNARISSVVFAPKKNQLQWQHVHETWMAAP